LKSCSVRFLLSCLVFAGLPAVSGAAADSATVLHISSRVPVQGPSRALAAQRPQMKAHTVRTDKLNPAANPWVLQATLPGAVIHDISFPTAKVGFAAAELGQVWKTSDGGNTWTRIMNLGFPYYWYGVHAVNANDVVISGFNDNNFNGLLRWSHDGGATWSADIVLTTNGWSDRVRFTNAQDGLVMDQLNLMNPNYAHYTTDGGQTAADWTGAVPDPNGGWFGDQFSMLANLRTRASGITYCDSSDGGADWSCRPSIDSVFDGPTFFADQNNGWVGGGEISPNVEGWVHRTTDGGQTWSGRTLDIGWPIREIFFLTPTLGWAVGGNIYTNQGGGYFSNDGGQTWSLDFDSNGSEMKACTTAPSPTPINVWCAGFNSAFNGVVYHLTSLSH
jgi:photosystem II stability/assembly factor-like uncharacterized protein